MGTVINQFQGEYRFLSNFWPCKIPYLEHLYPSVENAYQAAKCNSPEDRAQFITISAGEAKRLGRRIQIKDDWDDIKLDVMEFLVTRKFLRYTSLMDKLKETGSAEIVEGNYWGDSYWGVDLKTNSGRNELGKILMRIRDMHA